MLRITQSLLSAWDYVYKKEDGYEDFLATLNREKKPPTKAMLNGRRFEGLVNSALDGNPIPEDIEWYQPVMQLSKYLAGSQQQVEIRRVVEIDGVQFQLHGILDFLRSGIIFDTKFSTTYKVGKYLDSPQHPMYFALVPEAYEFQYLISDGTYVYREVYRPEDTEPIEKEIRLFMRYLEQRNLIDIFVKKWIAE